MGYVAFVPARSGSKRVPDKNIRKLAGKPLLVHTLEAFSNCDRVKKVILSTDSLDYWELANKFVSSDKLVLDLRTNEEAGDKVKIFDYIKSNAKKIFKDFECDVFLMGLPTVPLRNFKQVNAAIDLFENSSKPVFSAVEYGFPVSFAFSVDADNHWHSLFEHSPMLTGNTRSQDQVAAYHPNGAIYVRPVSDFKEQLHSLYEGAVPYVMDRISSVDIDNEVDFLIAESLHGKVV
ncbi:cytidylyltransferase domain-containing protein [Pontibacter sp. JAM-7]|uniref:acylneuraminate cytidylyltransferase family protein n=1 Tax=Pontibacter sp. JAM-7 TaxID=3366581 RepID=UPI003AF8954D